MSKNLRVKQARILRRIDARRERRLELRRDITVARKMGNGRRIFELYQSLTLRLGRRASPVHHRRVCSVTGRSRGNYRFFNLSRTEILRAWRKGHLFGIRKSSW